MARPTLLTVDDDPQVIQEIERDLRKRYGDRYRVLRASSGAQGLDLLNQLKKRGDEAALLLVDQRMPGMDGVQFLEQALPIYPRAKRALLTAYADTTAAIAAINKVHIDYYLLKPWNPPEQNLYPPLDDLLSDWQSNYRPPYEGIRVIGHRWSPRTHQVKDFLARNQIPFLWIDVSGGGTDAEALEWRERAKNEDLKLPLVILTDKTELADPDQQELAERIGMRTTAESAFYDLTIIGGGPAGLAAAVYGASEGLKTVVIERDAPGGQAGMSSRIENYLGFPAGLSGGDLARRAVTQAKRFGVEFLTAEATSLKSDGPYRIVNLHGSEVRSHAVLIATGLQWRKLDVPGVERLHGAGIYYGAAMTEALSCRDQDVYVVGGANSAGQAAMHFSQFASNVHMLVRGESLAATMSHYLIEQIEQTPNIKLHFQTEVAEAVGEGHLESLILRDTDTDERREVTASALFIFIGAVSCTNWLHGFLPMDERGFILAGPDLMSNGKRPAGWTLDRDPYLLETGVPGVFVAGDVRHGSVKRVASGVGEGSICVQMIHQYLSLVK